MITTKSLVYLVIPFIFSTAYSQMDSVSTLPKNANTKDSLSTSLQGTSDKSSGENNINTGEIYTLKPIADIPIVAIGAAWSGFAFTKIYSKEPPSEQEILNLNKEDIPSFDRWAAGKSDKKADDLSDLPFYGSMLVPFGLLADREIRKDAAKIGFLYLEAMAITGLIYTGSVYFVDRYRPETYNTSIPVEDRARGNNKDAFIGGHPAVVATGTFFTAKIYSDYHPESNLKYALYGVAIVATGATTYMRHIAGKHFPSDLFLGVSVGTLSGILVPHFHKNKKITDRNLGFMPFSNGKMHGFSMTYQIK